MTGQPSSGPLKYKVSATEEAPAPQRVHLPPPKKLRLSHWEALFRVVIVLVILASIAVAYWSFFDRLLPLQQQARSMVTKVSKMSEQRDQAERRWAPEQINEIRARYREVYRQLFADSAALEEWLSQIHTEAAPLALELNVQLGQAAPLADFTNNLAIVPASISLEVLPAPGAARGKSPYERVLAFGQQLAAHGKRADLAELTVTGGVGSISRAVLEFNLWAGDLGAEAALATGATNANHGAK
jgi:Tfp pilus assembly protein PilO